MDKPLSKVDYSEVERRVLASGVLPKGQAMNYIFLTMYGSNQEKVLRAIQDNTHAVTGRK